MKYALGSIMKEIDEAPELYFRNLDNNQQKEVYYNEVWKDMAVKEKLNIKDIVDKKQALLYGRSFKKLNIKNGRPAIEIVDPQHIIVDRYVDPADLDSAKVLIQTNIFKTLSDILANDNYSAKGRRKLKTYYKEMGEEVHQDDTNNKIAEDNQKMSDMGLEDAMDPVVGETYVELNEMYIKEFDKEAGSEVIRVYTAAVPGGLVIELQSAPLHEVIGDTVDNFWYDHYPISSWGTDIERTDFWSDAPADTLRGSAKVLNSFYSQLVENRTLRNYNMHYYDSTNPDFVPQTFEPVPWGWYPLPGKPSEVMTTVEVPDLSESLDEIQYIIGIAEKAVATTSAQTGSVEEKSVTLGEVQLALANAQERVRSIAIFYTESWKDFGLKYVKMLEGASDMLDPVTVVKEGRLGKKIYSREISPKNWNSKSGYSVEVMFRGEMESEALDELQKLNAAVSAMPLNAPLRGIYNKKLATIAGLTIEEVQQVMEFETKNPTPVAQPEAEGSAGSAGRPEDALVEVPSVSGAPFAEDGGVA